MLIENKCKIMNPTPKAHQQQHGANFPMSHMRAVRTRYSSEPWECSPPGLSPLEVTYGSECGEPVSPFKRFTVVLKRPPGEEATPGNRFNHSWNLTYTPALGSQLTGSPAWFHNWKERKQGVFLY